MNECEGKSVEDKIILINFQNQYIIHCNGCSHISTSLMLLFVLIYVRYFNFILFH